MDKSSGDYHDSLFQPTIVSARRISNMILQLVTVWAVAFKKALIHYLIYLSVGIPKQIPRNEAADR